MRWSHGFLLVSVFCLAFAPAPLPRRKADSDSQSLEGTWKLVRAEPMTWPEGTILSVIQGQRETFFVNGKKLNSWHLRIDRDRCPAAIDSFQDKKCVNRGVFEVRGRVLTICYDLGQNKRPTALARSDPDHVLEVWERQLTEPDSTK
jgi:uncharacterized protein (TIGR03067 family)